MINHVAFILDGNRRWAKKRGLPTVVGHTKGYNRIHEIVSYAKSLGIKYVTFWAFSTENWNRDPQEVSDLMNIFRKLFQSSFLNKIKKEKAKIVVFGDMTRFPEDIQKEMKKLLEDTKDNTGITLNIALNYGGRAEILRAVNTLLETNQTSVDESTFTSALYSHDQPDPDLIIRTGGELRLSGYLPWQSIYSELYFTQTLWPDFDKKALDVALADFASRQRRFGK